MRVILFLSFLCFVACSEQQGKSPDQLSRGLALSQRAEKDVSAGGFDREQRKLQAPIERFRELRRLEKVDLKKAVSFAKALALEYGHGDSRDERFVCQSSIAFLARKESGGDLEARRALAELFQQSELKPWIKSLQDRAKQRRSLSRGGAE